MVLWSIENSRGGEILVPKMPSYRVTDIAKAIGPQCKHTIIGLRPGEKIHEELITTSDSTSTVKVGDYFAILPVNMNYTLEEYCQLTGAELVPVGFSYNSGDNNHFLTISEIQSLIQKHVDPSFTA